LQIESEQGYLVLAVDREHRGYVAMAQRLCRSLRTWHPTAKVCLLTDQDQSVPGFDYVRTLPSGDQGGYANDWQVYRASPFRETIKLEADMLVTSHIDHWWPMLRHRDVVISTGARDYRGQEIRDRRYRRVFDDNHLPDVYNAITYWRQSQIAHDFFREVKMIFQSWERYRGLLRFAPDTPDTDLVYALAAEIVGRELVTMPFATYPSIIHMKPHVSGSSAQRWTDELIWERCGDFLRVGTITQWGCFHYHVKDWQP
jgi:hypothetical protein